MAIFHFSAKTVSRGDARSSTAAAAYRAGEKIVDVRTGEISNYKRKRGVGPGEVILPGGGTLTRSELWNKVEAQHKRGDAVVAREFEVALPHELTEPQQVALASEFFRSVADQYGVAVDWNLHRGHRGNRNVHVHGLMSACYCTPDGTMGKKAVELDPIHCKRAGIPNAMESQRVRWQDACNKALADAGHDARIDHRSHEARGLVEAPTQHHGPAIAGILSRGEPSHVAARQDVERAARQRLLVERARDEAQLVIARAQAAAADIDLRALEIADAARQEIAAAQRAKVAELARADALRADSQRLALLSAHAVYDAAVSVLDDAEAAETTARKRVDLLQIARDAAVIGQRDAGGGLAKSALALIKLPIWLKAIKLYDAAVQALTRAVRAVATARQKVAQAWKKVLGLDPAARTTQQQAGDALIAKLRPASLSVSAPVSAPVLVPVPAVHQHDDADGDGDDGLGAGSVPPPPGG